LSRTSIIAGQRNFVKRDWKINLLDRRPSGDGSCANCSQNRLPKHGRLGRADLAPAFPKIRARPSLPLYAARWTALVRCFDDGRPALDNNPAERALRCVVIGRKNYLFAGSDAGGRRAAALYSLIESAKLNGLNPQHYLADVLARIARPPSASHRRTPALEPATARRHLRRRLSRPAHRSSPNAYAPLPLLGVAVDACYLRSA
jgi:hypothetical protein